MGNLSKFTFETAYRQLSSVDRAFVDSFVARVELTSDTTRQDLDTVLAGIDVESLPAREQEHLTRAVVRAAISERVRDLKEAQNISPRRIAKRFAAMAFSSIDDFRRPAASLSYGLAEHEGFDGGLFELEYATPEQRWAVESIEVEEMVRSGKIRTKIKLRDPTPYLMKLAEVAGMFDREGNVTNPEFWAIDGTVSVDKPLDELADDYARVANES